MLLAGKALRKLQLLPAYHVHSDRAARNCRGGFNAVSKAGAHTFLYNKPVHHNFNAVLFILFKLYFFG